MIKIYGGCVLKSGDTMTGILNMPADLIIGDVAVAKISSPSHSLYIQGKGASQLGLGDSGSTGYVSISITQVLFPVQAPTASAPAYVLGGIYFDTTLNKLRIGGAAGWETVTSA